MTVKELISASRELGGRDLPDSTIDAFSYNPIFEGGKLSDANLNFRTELIKELLHDFSKADIVLIRHLFAEEMKCEIATRQHDNLYQLCYYLYYIGDLQDTFILYDAKFNTTNMDVGTMLDREMITVGHEIDEVIEYVQNEFDKNPELKRRYSGILDALDELKEFPDYPDQEAYKKFIKGYFWGHDNVADTHAVTPSEMKNGKSKPWWKFW